MVTISIGNSYSRITGLSVMQEKEVRKLLSYRIDSQAAYFSRAFNTTRYVIDKKGNFPTGVLPIATKYLTKSGIKYNTVDVRPVPKSNKAYFTDFKPNVVARAAQSDAINQVTKCHRGIIAMPTGVGKSFVIAGIIHQLKMKTLVIVPNLELKTQLQASLKELFGNLDHITIENIDSNALKSSRHYDCLIIDEAHHSAAKTYQNLNKRVWEGIYHRYFLTATPYRNNKEENLLFESICGQPIYELSYIEAINNDYIVPVEAYYFDLPAIDHDHHTWQQVYSNLIVRNEARNTIIASTITSFSPVLCLVKELAHGEALSNLTGVPFMNGQDAESRRHLKDFNDGKIKALIGTTGVLGEGVDTKPAEYIIIACLGKAKSAFLQQVGRGVRKYGDKESCKVILFRDKSHKFLLRHYREEVKILKEVFGITPIKLELPGK